MAKVVKNAQGFYETQIGGHKYEFAKWGAEKSLDVLMDLVTLIGEPASDVIANVTCNGVSKAEISEPQMAKLVQLLFAALRTNKAMVLATVRDLVGGSGVFADGKEFGKFVQFDEHYSDLGHMFAVVPAALEVQYGSFFAGLGTSGGISLLRAMAKMRPSTPADTGSTPTT